MPVDLRCVVRAVTDDALNAATGFFVETCFAARDGDDPLAEEE